MRPDPLPPGRPDLERQLAGRTCPEPPAGLRDRILAAVAAERSPVAGRPPRRRWRFAWQAAAAAVLALNLALSAANGLRFQALRSRVANPARVERDRPQPHPAPADDPFRAVAMAALAQLTPAPDAGPVGRFFFDRKEDR
jgi:hypothetical protein